MLMPTSDPQLRVHMVVYHSGHLSREAMVHILTHANAVTNWADIGLTNVIFVQTTLTAGELVTLVRERYRHPMSYIVANELSGDYSGVAPNALWDMQRAARQTQDPVSDWSKLYRSILAEDASKSAAHEDGLSAGLLDSAIRLALSKTVATATTAVGGDITPEAKDDQ